MVSVLCVPRFISTFFFCGRWRPLPSFHFPLDFHHFLAPPITFFPFLVSLSSLHGFSSSFIYIFWLFSPFDYCHFCSSALVILSFFLSHLRVPQRSISRARATLAVRDVAVGVGFCVDADCYILCDRFSPMPLGCRCPKVCCSRGARRFDISVVLAFYGARVSRPLLAPAYYVLATLFGARIGRIFYVLRAPPSLRWLCVCEGVRGAWILRRLIRDYGGVLGM
jgi:hypothetical protein